MAILLILLILAIALTKDTAQAIRNKAKNHNQQTKQSKHDNEQTDKMRELTGFIELIDDDNE